MLGEKQRARIKYEDSVTVGVIFRKQMLCENRTKTAATDNDDVKRPRIAGRRTVGPLTIFVRAFQRFIQAIIDIAAENVPGKVGGLRSVGCHASLPAFQFSVGRK
jgi:hypothetical protein